MFSAVPLFATGTCISLFLYGFFCCALIIYVFFLKFTMGFSFSRAALICIFPVAIRIFVAWYLLVSYLLPPLGDISTACGIAEEGRPIVFAIYKYEKRNDVWPLSLADISPENTSKDYMQSWTYSSSENFWCLSRALKKSANEMHEQPVPPNTPSVSFTFGIPDRPTRWILGYGRDNDWSLDVDQPIPNEDSK